MTANPSETAVAPEVAILEDLAESLASAVGGTAEVAYGTVKVRVAAARWREAVSAARDRFGFTFFSWLSAIDWRNDVAVGDGPVEPVEERYEMMCALSDLSQGRLVVISTDIDHEAPSIESLTGVFAGANWHEREAAEMFGIDFAGHPDLIKLYLPDSFQGYPLRKSFPLLSREVKPWPGKVDVEDMPEDGMQPSTDNPGS